MRIQDLTENDVVHCDTEEKAKKLCKMLHDSGKRWCNNFSYEDCNFWHVYKAETCYKPYCNSYGDREWFRNRNIIPFEQIEAPEYEFVPGVYWYFHGSCVELRYIDSQELMDTLDGAFELIKECEQPAPKLVKWIPSLEVPKLFWVFKNDRWIAHTGHQVVSNASGVSVSIGPEQISSERIYVRK